MKDRRTFLKTLGAAGAASAIPFDGVFGQERVVKLNVRGGAIDVHHHFQAPGMTGNRPWSPERSLEQMDKFGIGVAILSMTQNGDLLYNGTEKGRAAVRAGNEYGAKLMQQHPKQFGVMGGVPLPDIDGTLREIERRRRHIVHAVGHGYETSGRCDDLFGERAVAGERDHAIACLDGIHTVADLLHDPRGLAAG